MARHGRDGQLPERQALFVKEYLVDLNGTKAAIRAGYKEKAACEQAARLLAKDRVKAALKSQLSEHWKELAMSADEVIAELSKVARANMEDYVVHENGDITPDLSKCTRDQMAAVQQFTVDRTGGTGDGERRLVLRTTIKLADKHRPAETLARYHKLLIDRVEVTASDEVLAAIAEGHKRELEWQQRRQLKSRP